MQVPAVGLQVLSGCLVPLDQREGAQSQEPPWGL